MKKNALNYLITLTAFYLTLISTTIMAQRPSSVPYDREPVGFFDSVANIIFYIIIPAIIIVLYIIWRRKIRKEKLESDIRESEKNEVENK